jgi:hypothetical protein
LISASRQQKQPQIGTDKYGSKGLHPCFVRVDLWLNWKEIFASAIVVGLGLLHGAVGCAAEASKVTISADQVLVIDGKKVFPIGFTMPPPPDGKTPQGKSAIEELHDAGANFLRTGVMGTTWNDAALELEQKYHDTAARFGMHCLVNLRELGSIGPGRPRGKRSCASS